MKHFRIVTVGFCAVLLLQIGLVTAYFAQERGQASEEELFIYKAGQLRNPFVPLIVPSPTPTSIPSPTATPPPELHTGAVREENTPTPVPTPKLRLDGVFADAKRPVAIINNQVLRIGESIEGARVTRVKSDAVYLEFKGRSMKLVLPEEYSISID